MVLAVITPHPAAPQLARHTYLCGICNQTTSYVLPVNPSVTGRDEGKSADGSGKPHDIKPDDRRKEAREALAAPATIYDKDGNFLLPCTVRDLSKTGARLELFKEATLPQFFLLSLLPDGGGRRLCSKVWQIALIAGVRFVEKQKP
jgi:hypothetical protein